MQSFDSTGKQFAWDATSISLAETCLYKYKLKALDGWQPKGKSVHLVFGGWYASALERWHKLMTDGMTSDEALLDVIHRTLHASWEVELTSGEWVFADTYPADDNLTGQGRPWESDHNLKTRFTLIRSIVWYVDQFENDTATTVLLDNGKPAVELSFTFDLDNGLMLCGHMDRVVELNGDTYIMDQKTTGMHISNRYFDSWSPDTQMSCYTFAGQAIYNLPVKGVVLDVAQIAVGFTRFERGFIFRSKGSLAEWYDVSMYHIQQARRAVEENFFPMNRASCGNYGGCEFRKICSRSPEVRDNFLRGDFVQSKRWDPLERR